MKKAAKKAAKKAVRASRSTTAKSRVKTDHAVKIALPAKTSPKDQDEAQHHVETLEANRQIARGPGEMPPGTTHRIESDASGERRLVRKRFSAI